MLEKGASRSREKKESRRNVSKLPRILASTLLITRFSSPNCLVTYAPATDVSLTLAGKTRHTRSWSSRATLRTSQWVTYPTPNGSSCCVCLLYNHCCRLRSKLGDCQRHKCWSVGGPTHPPQPRDPSRRVPTDPRLRRHTSESARRLALSTAKR